MHIGTNRIDILMDDIALPTRFQYSGPPGLLVHGLWLDWRLLLHYICMRLYTCHQCWSKHPLCIYKKVSLYPHFINIIIHQKLKIISDSFVQFFIKCSIRLTYSRPSYCYVKNYCVYITIKMRKKNTHITKNLIEHSLISLR